MIYKIISISYAKNFSADSRQRKFKRDIILREKERTKRKQFTIRALDIKNKIKGKYGKANKSRRCGYAQKYSS